MLNRIRTGYTLQHFRPPRFIKGSVAEWSKALVLGTSPKGRGFESHRCQNSFIAGRACWSRGMILASGARGPGFNSRTSPLLFCSRKKEMWRHRGSNPGHLACEASALPLSYIPIIKEFWYDDDNLHNSNMCKVGRVV